MHKQKLLVFVDWYVPAYKAGGPIQSVHNFAIALQQEFDIYIFTSNIDNDNTELTVEKYNDWIKGNNNELIYYCSKDNYSKKLITQIVKEVQPNKVYLNSMFSMQYAIQPLLICKKNKIETILAPRGMLQSGALQFKSTKKKIFLKLLQLLNAFKYTTFQATDTQEQQDIYTHIGKNAKVIEVQNFAKAPIAHLNSIEKKAGQLKLIFISRIVPKKNLDFLLNCIAAMPPNTIELNIYGEIGAQEYGEKCLVLIKTLSSKQVINYKGALQNSEVAHIIQQHHLFALLSHGENFGHAIYEALAAARPILVSNKTPWQNLTQNRQGWDVDISNTQHAINALNEAISWNQNMFENYSNNALQLAKSYYNNKTIKQQYLKLFS